VPGFHRVLNTALVVEVLTEQGRLAEAEQSLSTEAGLVEGMQAASAGWARVMAQHVCPQFEEYFSVCGHSGMSGTRTLPTRIAMVRRGP
jgi:hypothetical protein